jgi:hypothetical protein
MHVSTITEHGRPIDAIGETSAVSWGAIIAGAFATAALVLALMLLGTGLGLLSISPWTNSGASATTIGLAAAIWLVIVHILSSGLGGFITGRLRTKWPSTPIDEIFFRDTAHGFLAWAVSLVIGVGLLAAIALTTIGSGAQIGTQALATVGSAATTAAAQQAGRGSATIADPTGYFVDVLFRSRSESPSTDDAATRAEVGRILASGFGSGDISSADRAYLAQIVAARTGLEQTEAEKRVADVIRHAKDARTRAEENLRSAADTARRSGAYFALWSVVALLAGAFASSFAATIGGKARDA